MHLRPETDAQSSELAPNHARSTEPLEATSSGDLLTVVLAATEIGVQPPIGNVIYQVLCIMARSINRGWAGEGNGTWRAVAEGRLAVASRLTRHPMGYRQPGLIGR